MTLALHDINTLAADALEEHGWTQGEMEAEDGSLCLVGALRHCSPRPGDWLIAREVYRRLDHAEGWNDEKGRTEEEIVSWLRAHPVTDADLEATFGPHWEAIVRLVRRTASLTDEQANALYAVWDAAVDAARSAAWDAAKAAAWYAAWDAVETAAWYAARGDARSAAWDAARSAAWDAAKALVVADLVGQHGLTQDHVDTLLAPWVSVMGDPRDVVARRWDV